MAEEWRPVVGYEGLYEISSHGRVKSLPRKITVIRKGFDVSYISKEIIMAQMQHNHFSGTYYYKVGLRKDNIGYTVLVHRMVAEAFIPNPLDRDCINHIDNDPTNNHVENLEWCNRLENAQHRNKQGRQAHGVRSATAKLTDDIVRKIRKEWPSGKFTNKGLARQYGIDQHAMRVMIQGKTWKHVKIEDENV